MHSLSRRSLSFRVYFVTKRCTTFLARQEAFYASLRQGDRSPSLLQWIQYESDQTWRRFVKNVSLIPVVTSIFPEIGPAGKFDYYWKGDGYYRRPVNGNDESHVLCTADSDLVHMAISPEEKQLVRVFQDGSVFMDSKRQHFTARAVEFGPLDSLYWIAIDGTVWRSSELDPLAECVFDGPSHPAISLRRSKGGSAMLLENGNTTWVWQHNKDGTISEHTEYDKILLDVHRNGRIVSLPATTEDADWWNCEMDLFADHVVAYQRSLLHEQYRFIIQSEKGRSFVSDESIIDPFAKLTPCGNMQYDTDLLRFRLEKPYQPPMTYEFNMTTHQLEHLSWNAPSSQHTSPSMSEQRIFATSCDGTQIPITVFHRHDKMAKRVLLAGYGAYGKSAEWSYDPLFHYLLEQGIAVAYANIRNDKLVGIRDYIACAHRMQSYGSVTAYGVSAGGVVVGASLQEAPNAFHSGVLINAFLDVEATLRNPDLYLTKEDWDDYGNPETDPSIASYCPVQNVTSGGPPVLVISTLDDERVPYWNALIYTHKRGTENSHLYMEPTGGHSWNGDRQRMMALQASFVLDDSI